MKLSACGSMAESCVPKAEGSPESLLQNLYIDLCNLIVESRIPGLNERGYGDGIHCPPLLGLSTHQCDVSKPECQKHQRLIHHLLRAVGSNVFQIDVLMLPECCAESKLKERIQNKEYILLERWSMNCICSKVQSSIEVPQLLRAVRSFLHFSQVSAWLSSTKGKSPSNVYYWVKPNLEGSSSKFETKAEVHSFPICKISDELYGSVQVEYTARTEYIPIIPCSKHPPLRSYSLRTINEDNSLCQNISLNPQIIRQLHKTCEKQQSMFTSKTYVSEPPALVLTPSSLFQTLASNRSDGKMPNRVLKHSNCQDTLMNASHLSLTLNKSKNIEMISRTQTAYVCDISDSYSKGQSQENVYFQKRNCVKPFCKTQLKLKTLNNCLTACCNMEVPAPIDLSKVREFTQDPMICNEGYIGISPQISNLEVKMSSSNKSFMRKTIETSLKNLNNEETNLESKQSKKTKSFKHKVSNECSEKKDVLPHKRQCCDKKHLAYSIQNIVTPITEAFSLTQTTSQINEEENYLNKNIDQASYNRLHSDSCMSHKTKTIHQYLPKKKDIHYSKYVYLSSKVTYKNKKHGSLINDSENTHLKKYFQIRKRAMVTANALNEEHIGAFSKLNYEENSINDFYNNEHNIESVPKKKLKQEEYPSTLSSNIFTNICEESKYKISISSKTEKSNFDNSICQSTEYMKLKKNLTVPKCLKLNTENDLKSFKELYNNSTTKEKSKTSMLYQENQFSGLSRIISVEHTVNKKTRSSNYKNTKSKTFKKSTRCLKSMEDLHSTMIKRSRKNKFHNYRNKSCKLADNRKKDKLSKIQIPTKSESELLSSSQIHTDTTVRKPNFLSYSCQNIIPISASTKEKCKIDPSATFSNLEELQGFIPKLLYDADRNDNYHESDKSLSKPNMISHQNNRQAPVILNRFIPSSMRNLLLLTPNENIKGFSKRISHFPKGRKLLGNFEESILNGCLPKLNSVKGFYAEIGASGSFCPNHLTLPADVSFYDLGNSHQAAAAPYVAHVILGDSEYYLPKRGAVQVTLFNPSETVVKMFVLNYDLSNMPALCHTFIRQKLHYLPVGFNEEYPTSQKWLRFIIHLRFASSKTGKIYLHKDFKIVVLNKTHDDAASEFSKEPRELRSFLSVPMNPKFSSF